MTTRLTLKRAWLVTSLGLLLIVLAVGLAYLGRATPTLEYADAWQGQLIAAIPPIAFLLCGALVAARRPDNRFGWLMLAVGFSGGSLAFADSLSLYAYYVAGLPLWVAALPAMAGGYSWIVSVTLIAFILLLFPTGHYLTRRWRLVGLLALLALAVTLPVAWALPGPMGSGPEIDNPFAPAGPFGAMVFNLINTAVYIIFSTILLGVVSILIRFRRSVGQEREQIKWFAYGSFVLGVAFISDSFSELPGIWEVLKESLMFTILPVCIVIAILRYRLYDIDVVIRKTLVYASLTGLLALVYFSSVILLQQFFITRTRQESTLTVVFSTLLIAALFTPLRRRVQRIIDRRFFRQRYDAQQALASFNEAVRNETDPDRLTAELLRVVEETVQPKHVSLWLRSPGPGERQ